MSKKNYLLLGLVLFFLLVSVLIFSRDKDGIETIKGSLSNTQQNINLGEKITEEDVIGIQIKELSEKKYSNLDLVKEYRQEPYIYKQKSMEIEKEKVIEKIKIQQEIESVPREWVLLSGKKSGNKLGKKDKKLGMEKIKFVAKDENPKSKIENTILIQAKNPSDFDKQIEQIKEMQQTEDIFFIEPNYTYEMMDSLPNDIKFDKQWGLDDNHMDISKVWNFNKGENVVVAIIDSGIDNTHEDIINNLWEPEQGVCVDWDNNSVSGGCNNGGYDIVNNDDNPFADDGATHGTHVAGIIGATANNQLGIAGVSPNVKIMSLRACDGNQNSMGNCIFTVETISKSIYFAVNNGADIINMSLGGSAYSYSIQEAITYAYNKGVIVVAAAGNSGKNNDINSMYPANLDLDNIISVAAIDKYNHLASFSNYGKTSVDIGAPGVEILSTVPMDKGKYDYKNGTSMATPHVTAVAALIKSENMDYNFANIKTSILSGGIEIDSLKTKTISGKKLDAYKAVSIDKVPLIGTIDIRDRDGNTLEGILENGAINIKINMLTENNSVNNNGKYTLIITDESEEIIKTAEIVGYQDGFVYSFDHTGVYILSISSESEFGRGGNTKTLELDITIEEEIIEEETEDDKIFYIKIPEDTNNDFIVENKEISINLDIDSLQVDNSQIWVELVESLEKDPIKIYEYVMENLEYTPYVGMRKSVENCLETKKCNDVEISSVLLNLYRTAGIPSVYVQGYIKLDIDLFQKIFQTANKRDVYKILLSLGNKVQALDENGNLLSLGFNEFEDVVDSIVFESIWIKAYLEDNIKPQNNLSGLELEQIIAHYIDLQDDNMQLYGWRDIVPYIGTYVIDEENIQQLNLEVLYSQSLSGLNILDEISNINKYDIEYDLSNKLGILPIIPAVRELFVDNIQNSIQEENYLDMNIILGTGENIQNYSVKVLPNSLNSISIGNTGYNYQILGIDEYITLTGDVDLEVNITYNDKKIIERKEKINVSDGEYTILAVLETNIEDIGLGYLKEFSNDFFQGIGYNLYYSVGLKLGNDLDFEIIPFSLFEDISYQEDILEMILNSNK